MKLKLEQIRGREFQPSKSTVLWEGSFYEPTFLEDDQGYEPTGQCSLFVRHYRLFRTPSGKLRAVVVHNVESYRDVDTMADAIRARGLKECPEALDWIPPDLLAKAEEAK